MVKQIIIDKQIVTQEENEGVKPRMDFLLAKNLLDLKAKIIKADKNSVVVFDEGIK